MWRVECGILCQGMWDGRWAVISVCSSVLIRRALGRVNSKGACGNGKFPVLLRYRGLSR